MLLNNIALDPGSASSFGTENGYRSVFVLKCWIRKSETLQPMTFPIPLSPNACNYSR